jgi:general secretion pathway protein K
MRTEGLQTRGSALLAVLWLAAGLSAIAFAVATTVRGETERTSTTADATRAYFLAAGSIDRAILWRAWGLVTAPNPDGTPRYYRPPMTSLNFDYPSGKVLVEVVPEGGKLNVNSASPQQLQLLLSAMGVEPSSAQQLAGAIVDWRTPAGPPQIVPLSPGPPSTFTPRHASFQELEEILLVPGMTPELFYGHYNRDASGRLVPQGGLRDSLTVYGSGEGVDVNTAPPPLLLSLGIPQSAVDQIMAQRPYKSMDEVRPLIEGAPGAASLHVGGNTIWTLRATARLKLAGGKLGDLRRSVAAMVKYFDKADAEQPYQILRWYDDAWSPAGSRF